jgi:2-(3-amino-3-carboxypropyl)histidine synthase
LKIPGYTIDLEKAVRKINSESYKRIVLQIPEGLKIHFKKFVDFFEEKTSADVIISGDPCFGACDIGYYEFKDLNVDFIVQIGHVPIPNIKEFYIPMIFINAKAEMSIDKLIEKTIPSINGKQIGLVTNSQHGHLLSKAKKILEKNGFDVNIGYGYGRINFEGQILGCNFSAATSIKNEVDLFLFIGSGTFHPLGLMLSTGKPVIACDPYTNKVSYKELDDMKDIILRQRYGAISRSQDARVFGILVGIKKGQQRIELANEIKEKLSSKNKKSYIFALNYFTPSNIESYRNIDCFVSTACPRIAIDDYMQYKTPIITPVELDIVLGLKKWEDYKFDEMI